MEAGLKTVRSNWSNTLLVCRKCSKKLGGGFGPKGRTPLAKALRQELGVGKGRKGALGIVEVKCLGVCPKGAVTVINGAAPGAWLLVETGADMSDIAGNLRVVLSATSSDSIRHPGPVPGSTERLGKAH